MAEENQAQPQLRPGVMERLFESAKCDGCYKILHGFVDALHDVVRQIPSPAPAPLTAGTVATWIAFQLEANAAITLVAQGRHVCEEKFGRRDLVAV